MGDEAEKVRGFRFGADDYVTKPFSLLELLARVSALLRRGRAPAAVETGTRLLGDITINTSTREVSRAGVPIGLRPKEFDLLMALVQRDGAVASREELLQDVWGYDDSVFSRTVDTHIAELRRKLEEDPSAPRWLLTVRKAGYRVS
jgi:DNA-binding response OmpR family regulator